MIDTLTVWHGPVFGMYADEARANLDGLSVVSINCSESSLNTLPLELPEGDLFANDVNGIWIHDLNMWPSDEVNKAMKFLDKHEQKFRISVTSDRAPVKSVADAALAVHNFDIPKNPRDYAKQISEWLGARGRVLDQRASTLLVEYCDSDPAAAQRVAATLSTFPAGTLQWAEVHPIVSTQVEQSRPMWEIGKAISSGNAKNVIIAIEKADTKEPFVVLRFLENRYRMMLLGADGVKLSEAKAVFPEVNDYALRMAIEEGRGLSVNMCVMAMTDIAASFEHLMSCGADLSATVLESCAMKLVARHALARR